MTKLEKLIVGLPPSRWIARKSKHWYWPGFEGLPLYDVGLFFLRQVKRVGMSERAAAISYNFIMAIPAGLIFLCTLIPYLPISKQFTRELLIVARDITPNTNTYTWVRDLIVDFLNKPRTGLLSFGFFLVAFYASNAMIGIMRTFDRSFIEGRKRNFVHKRWTALRLTTILILLVMAFIIVLITQKNLLSYLLNNAGIRSMTISLMIRSVRWVIIVGLFLFTIGFIYRYAPATQKKWKYLSPGTLLATTLITIMTNLFSFWVNHFNNFNKIYGSIGTVMILMLLIFLNSLFLLLGFELNVSIRTVKGMSERQVVP